MTSEFHNAAPVDTARTDAAITADGPRVLLIVETKGGNAALTFELEQVRDIAVDLLEMAARAESITLDDLINGA